MALADDHGGADALDESTRVSIRQAAGLTVEAENLQRRIARGEPVNHEDLVRVARVLNQLMRQLGLKKASLELSNGVEIGVMTNSLRAVRGRTVAFVCLDEVAFYRSDDSANPDVETYNALKPGMATIPEAMLVGISSPYRKSGLLYSKWKSHYGRDDDGVLVIRAASQVLNPTLDQAIVDEAMERDPAAARAEYFAEWRADISGFIDAELIEGCIERDVDRRPPRHGETYRGFVDVSGGRSDSAVLTIGHRCRDRIILDVIVERRAPYSPDSIAAEFAGTLKAYGLGTVTGDAYGAEWTTERFGAHGVIYQPSELNRSEIYLNFLPAATSGQVDLLDNRKMVSQFAQLERRTSRAGRDTIDHPSGGHDDVSNAVAGCITLLAVKKQFPAHGFTPEANQAFAAIMRQKFPDGPGGGIRPIRMVF
jgi:hypothetical protein